MALRSLLLLVMSTFLLAACGPGNTVRLLDPQTAKGVMPAPNAPTVAVVGFADKRVETYSVGERRDKSAFTTDDNVARWVSMALAEELRSAGYQVSYALSFDQAQHARPDYMVRGEVLKVWLQEVSATELQTELKAKFSLANKQKVVVRETVNANQQHTGLPSGSAAEKLLADTLQDLVKTMSEKILATVATKKK